MYDSKWSIFSFNHKMFSIVSAGLLLLVLVAGASAAAIFIVMVLEFFYSHPI